MSKLVIIDLNFRNKVLLENIEIKGSGSDFVPTISTDISTVIETRLNTGLTINGNVQNGININGGSVIGFAAAGAASLAIGGKARAFTFVWA